MPNYSVFYLVCAFGVALTTAVHADADEGGALATAQYLVRQDLKDPDSAQFSDDYTFRYASDGSITGVCGRVNAKNSFGGYTGYTPFMTVGFRAIVSHKLTPKTLSFFCPGKRK